MSASVLALHFPKVFWHRAAAVLRLMAYLAWWFCHSRACQLWKTNNRFRTLKEVQTSPAIVWKVKLMVLSQAQHEKSSWLKRPFAIYEITQLIGTALLLPTEFQFRKGWRAFQLCLCSRVPPPASNDWDSRHNIFITLNKKDVFLISAEVWHGWVETTWVNSPGMLC